MRITVSNILRCIEGEKIWEEWPFDGTRAHTMAPFEHLHGFVPCSLSNLIERAGYEEIKNHKNYNFVSSGKNKISVELGAS